MQEEGATDAAVLAANSYMDIYPPSHDLSITSSHDLSFDSFHMQLTDQSFNEDDGQLSQQLCGSPLAPAFSPILPIAQLPDEHSPTKVFQMECLSTSSFGGTPPVSPIIPSPTTPNVERYAPWSLPSPNVVSIEHLPTDTQPSSSHHPITQNIPWKGFKIVGDNVDKTVNPRYMRSDKQSQSLHYFQSYAVRDRIDLSDFSDIRPRDMAPSPEDVMKQLLPSPLDDESLHANFEIHIARILVDNMPALKLAFEDSVDWHIQHQHSKEIKRKSEVVNSIACINYLYSQ